MSNAKHSKATVNWGTPADIVERSRRALGGRIELDPMSSPEFNKFVGAERIYTKDDDGLKKVWRAETLFINPPGGLVVQAWEKLAYSIGDFRRAIWIGFSVEQLCLLANHMPNPLYYPTLICRKRISFIRDDGYTGSPSHGNYISAIGVDPDLFAECFRDLGAITG